ncbi:glycosyltransferase [Nesterenkonia sp. MY13]|uniref:Glycosyltransferase n=1 Tax=Nesterenkonia sedimenti TaxID=1463632 RepID=A0A7X8YCM8_9MICC|nr:glycosyltransferase [Nesterenkonia sedimenti]NLS08754.1 glycosyltransferase [Nesterenkonia sedimenti]
MSHPHRVVMLSLHTSPLAQAGTGDAGGLNVYVNALAHALLARGHTVDIVTTDLDWSLPEPGEADTDKLHIFEDTGLRVHVLKVCRSCREDKSRLIECLHDLGARALESLRRADSAPVAVVHSHYWISGLAAMGVAEQLGARLVHTMHTIGAVKEERDPHAVEDPRRHEAEQQIAASAAALTANTIRESADLQRIFGVGPERIAMVHPGTDLEVFHPPVGDDPRCTPPDLRPLKLTFAGRLQLHKGPQVAVGAIAEFRRLMPHVPVQLTVAGRQSGPDAIDIPALAEQEGVDDVVVYSDPLPHPELAELFRDSDAVLVPSYSESFGLVALEAKACGTPVLAHNVGGLAELVDHGATGMLIDSLEPELWGQALQQLVGDWEQWQAYSAEAARCARKYSWDATAGQALDAYQLAQVAGTPG